MGQDLVDRLDWAKQDSWIAVFDILGFKNIIRETNDDTKRIYLILRLNDLLKELKIDELASKGIEHLIISDTIILFSITYGFLLSLCKKLIERSIYIELPLRGALSYGATFRNPKYPTILIGPAFVEAYEYCEGQDWIGFLLTPSATKAVRNDGLEPLHHHFVSDELPLKNDKLSPVDVVAYRFQGGSSNFDSPLLAKLKQMQFLAPVNAKSKYTNTIQFIERYYQKQQKRLIVSHITISRLFITFFPATRSTDNEYNSKKCHYSHYHYKNISKPSS
jgi:hypothetical protein